MSVPDTQIAVQMYNFREHCRTQADLANTLKHIRDIGYRAVQMVDLRLDMPIEAVAVPFAVSRGEEAQVHAVTKGLRRVPGRTSL